MEQNQASGKGTATAGILPNGSHYGRQGKNDKEKEMGWIMTEKEVRVINGKEVVLYRDIETGLYRFGKDAVDILFESFEECEKYKEIGTVEECKTAMEKVYAKKRTILHGNYYCCECGRLAKESGHCRFCGQSLY